MTFKKRIGKLENLGVREFLDVLKQMHQEWFDYLHSTQLNNFTIDEGNFQVDISLDEVIFNLVNHSSYHRGQIMMLLR